MARLPRPDLASVAQHVVQRGNDRLACFYDDDDRRRYLTALRHVATRYTCLIHAYVLMPNHVHLLVTPVSAGAVSRMMQTLCRLYVSSVLSATIASNAVNEFVALRYISTLTDGIFCGNFGASACVGK